MSSPVHTARCVRRDGRTVEIELGPTTATSAHFPISPTFALALLHESASDGRRAKAPLASVITFDEMIELSSISEPNATKDGLVATFIASARYVATRNWTPTLWTRDASGAFVDPGVPATDPRAIAAADTLDDAWSTVCDASEPLGDGAMAFEQAHAPHATLRIEVTDERWCAHLVPSMTWDVYAFDYAASLLV